MKGEYLAYPIEFVDDLKPTEILVLSQLAYLRRQFQRISASNDYISSKLGLGVATVSRAITTLSNKHYITVKLNTKNYKTKRTIYLSKKTMDLYSLGIYVKPTKRKDVTKSKPLKDFLNME